MVVNTVNQHGSLKFPTETLEWNLMGDSFASWLNAQIEARNMSARAVGRLVGVSHTTIVKLANGQSAPSVKMCRDLARAFGVSLDEVYRAAGIMPALVSDEPAVSGLLSRLEEMDPVSRREVVALVSSVLDFIERQATNKRASGAKARPRLAAISPAEERAQFERTFYALPEEEQRDLLEEAQKRRRERGERAEDPTP